MERKSIFIRFSCFYSTQIFIDLHRGTYFFLFCFLLLCKKKQKKMEDQTVNLRRRHMEVKVCTQEDEKKIHSDGSILYGKKKTVLSRMYDRIKDCMAIGFRIPENVSLFLTRKGIVHVDAVVQTTKPSIFRRAWIAFKYWIIRIFLVAWILAMMIGTYWYYTNIYNLAWLYRSSKEIYVNEVIYGPGELPIKVKNYGTVSELVKNGKKCSHIMPENELTGKFALHRFGFFLVSLR